jgi:hypothetical protein
MTKSRNNRRSSFFKNIKNTSSKALPVLGKGLETVGTTAKHVAVESAPIIERGVSTVYGTLASGFDLGVKGVKSTFKKGKSKSTSKKGRSKSHRRRKTHRRRR